MKKGSHHTEKTKKNISAKNAKYWKGKTLSVEHKKKISESEKGEKNHNYIDGRNCLLTNWSRTVKIRDNYTCQICGKTSQDIGSKHIHAHHMKFKTIYPELIYDVDNGITLCHKGEHKNAVANN